MARRLQPQVRRARILDTAMAIIDHSGHRGLTMARLARECDMSTPGLMHYFPDIATLLVAVVEHRDQRDVAALRTRVGDVGPDVPVRAVLDAIVDNIVERPQAALLFASVEADALDPAHPGHAFFRERADALAAWFADAWGEGDGAASDGVEGQGASLALARRVFATMDGLQIHYLRDPEGFDLRAQWAAAADALLGSQD